MKGIVIAGPGKVEIREMEKPAAGKGEALLRPLFGGICGSDLNSYRGTNAYLTYPRIPGHELSAEIAEIGENDRGFRVGDVVTVNPYFNCGTCYSCRRGLVNACMSNQTMGVQRDDRRAGGHRGKTAGSTGVDLRRGAEEAGICRSIRHGRDDPER